MVSFGFENPTGLYAFLALIPFIILYLVRPKPKELEVPSLMFFMKAKSTQEQKSFFKRFIKDWLFFLQLLILLLLALTFTSPYLNLSSPILVDNSVLVLDTSASTQINNNQVFKDVIQAAKDNLGNTNTIILAGSSPKLILKDKNKREAQQILKALKPTDERSNIGEAILLAGNHLGGENSKLTIISDFMNTEGTNVNIARNTLQSKNVAIEFIDVKNRDYQLNVGFVNVESDKETSKIYVKNFNDKKETATIDIEGTTKTLSIDPGAIDSFTISHDKGVVTLSLEDKDDFMADNTIHISIPEETPIHALLITDEPSLYLQAALSALPNMDLRVTDSSSIPSENFDIYIVHNIDKNNNLKQLSNTIKSGKSIVIHAQQDSSQVDYGGLLPLTLGLKQDFAAIEIQQVNRFTKNIQFGAVPTYFATRDLKGSQVASANNNSIIQLHKLEEGTVVYYGLLEDSSEFKLSPDYPIFWTNLVRFLANQDELSDLNYQTGDILVFTTKQDIKTPTKTKKQVTSLVLDTVGVYEVKGKKITASLLSELESDLNRQNSIESEGTQLSLQQDGETVLYNIETLIIIIVAVLLFIELLIAKSRGDI